MERWCGSIHHGSRPIRYSLGVTVRTDLYSKRARVTGVFVVDLGRILGLKGWAQRSVNLLLLTLTQLKQLNMAVDLAIFQRDLARRLRFQGKSLREIAQEIGRFTPIRCHYAWTIALCSTRYRGTTQGALTANEDEESSHGLSIGSSMSQTPRSTNAP